MAHGPGDKPVRFQTKISIQMLPLAFAISR